MNSREQAYFALRQDKVKNFFQDKKNSIDLRLAQEIAYTTQRRLLSLEYIVKKIGIKLKKREKLLFFTALTQIFFLSKIPMHAIVNETVALAKKYFGIQKASLFNFFLRNLHNLESLKSFFQKPKSLDLEHLSVFYSYPKFFIQSLKDQYGEKKAFEILKIQNMPSKLFVRTRKNPFNVLQIKSESLKDFLTPEYYIQNITPVLLIQKLYSKPFFNILDLCAAPGGKLLLLADIFKANLFANDKPSKLSVLKENICKYDLKVTLISQDAHTFNINKKFDLIVIDAPCSNSGVLYKRQEARWRLTEENIKEHALRQIAFIKNAKNHLLPNGEIWYLTCSILKQENEQVMQQVCQETNLYAASQHTILPDISGKDGGFCALLKFNS